MSTRDELILANLIANRVETQPDLDVLTFVNIDATGACREEVRSYAQLWANAQRIAAALDERGLEPGQSFALLLQNHPEFVEAMIAASITGTVFVPIDPRVQGAKLKYMLEFAECRGVIFADYAEENLHSVRDELPALEWGIQLDTGLDCGLRDGAVPMEEIMRLPVVEQPIRSVDPDAPMQMLYTSGTTGDPKAIRAPHRRFGEVSSLGTFLGLEPGDRPYTGLSLTHANAQLLTLGCSLNMGLRAVISRRFTKSRLWDITRRYGCTVFNLLGGMTTAIYSEPRKDNDADNPVRYVISAGMPKAIWNDFKTRFGVEVFEFYGAAEGGLTLNPMGRGPVGSIGMAPPSMTVTIRDADDNECPRGSAGEICFRYADGSTPQVTYFKNPEASRKKTRGGWLRMGDIGHMDEEGWLYFHYRDGGGIRRNGDFVNPAYIEKVIAEQPQVSDVFVYGVPAASGAPGEKDIVAAIVPDPGAVFDPGEVFRSCKTELEANFIPSYLQLVDDIPKTASEKPQERFLIAMFDSRSDRVFGIDSPQAQAS
ncbi:ATP-dependent acyl-CoA ligase [Marinobacterium nitratireducens]|uniref:ATP-dependent acyl-CoA ligase n=1 Tax=Marinobacterium nitratireducens TaxID=518897 RepID=A0A917ZQA6_9GAMM|nr:AMP-binding protein [Marinobacterium nitratireducens]GGO89442.1 ATP-dependent acyl-CoA ligase [Marinobacterium nitratireducens]